jgi:hypothetical protein
VLKRPPLSRETHARLHLVEDQQSFMAIGDLSEGAQKLAPEMVIPTLPLNWLDQNRCDLSGEPLETRLSLYQRLGF